MQPKHNELVRILRKGVDSVAAGNYRSEIPNPENQHLDMAQCLMLDAQNPHVQF